MALSRKKQIEILTRFLLNVDEDVESIYIPCIQGKKKPIKGVRWSCEPKDMVGCLNPKQAVKYENVPNGLWLAIRPKLHSLFVIDIDAKENGGPEETKRAVVTILRKIGIDPAFCIPSSDSGGWHIGYYFTKHKPEDRDRTLTQWGVTYEVKSNSRFICCRGIAERYAKPFLKKLDSGYAQELPRSALKLLMPQKEIPEYAPVKTQWEVIYDPNRKGTSTYGSVEKCLAMFPGPGGRDDYLNNHLKFWRHKWLNAGSERARERYKNEALMITAHAMSLTDTSFTPKQVSDKYEDVFLGGR